MSVSVFISWSGPRSLAYAQIVKKLVKNCFTDSKQFVSKEDIAKGTIGFNTIANTLGDAKVGIICLTRENFDKPWICYEAGSLANGTAEDRVCPLLIDIDHIDSKNPISNYQHTAAHKKDDVRMLLSTINDAYGVLKRGEDDLDESFNMVWPTIEKEFAESKKHHDEIDTLPKPSPPNNDDLLSEILEITRDTQHRVQRIPLLVSGTKSRLLYPETSKFDWETIQNSDDPVMKFTEEKNIFQQEVINLIAASNSHMAKIRLNEQGYGNKAAYRIIGYFSEIISKIDLDTDPNSILDSTT